MTTLKEISLRIKSAKNVKKVTQCMKMVSAVKYSRAERDLKQARPIGEGAKMFYKAINIKPIKSPDSNELLVAMTSDQGFSGVHTEVTKAIKKDLESRDEQVKNTKIACVGDKSRAILQRKFGDKFIFVANKIGRTPPTFVDASRVANNILESDFTYGRIIFNKFKSVVSYACDSIPIFSAHALESAENIAAYDSVDPEVLKDYMEYSLASLIYFTMKESACAEQSSRMTAMDKASKNADKMIDKLTIQLHRTRQAVITRELIDIVKLPVPASFNIFQFFQYKK